MRFLIDFKQDSYGKLVEFLLPEDNCLIKSKLTILCCREICHLSLPSTKTCSKMFTIGPSYLVWVLLFSGPVLVLFIYLRMNVN